MTKTVSEDQESNRAYQPIECDDHDFVEIACLDAYEVELVTDDGPVTGIAETTRTEAEGEFLCLKPRGDVAQRVRLDRIRRLIVLTRPSRFREHDFRAPRGNCKRG
ncbi:MAG TPA: Rho-binding antiterminator [Woeseiaceae bacterium]|nr:Rho-binding antiterminator [Woeseiaceae bacterium]